MDFSYLIYMINIIINISIDISLKAIILKAVIFQVNTKALENQMDQKQQKLGKRKRIQ